MRLQSIVLTFTVLLVSISAPAKVDAGGMVQYNRDIRPILSDNCFACHGPDANKRAADLRLDRREDALQNLAIVPNNPDQSEILKRILSTDPESVMPPPESHKTLTQAQIDLLRQWIAEGAEYQGHWAFIAPAKPELPQVRNKDWVRNPIDRFVLSELERRGLQPSPESELRTLIRRVCYDLTGLPPTPEEIQQVLSDPSPDRYENYVDELLKRPAWGEHRGRYWLDYARYADTHGIHFDNFREMWSYRDWVIKAFNKNQPFDQFTIEQLAGDLLPNANLDQRIATGFNRCNITTNEGGIIDEEYHVLYTRDRVETTGQVWMGLTVGCAVCHDHKFDPISQSEFYQMAAFFNNTTQGARDGNIRDTPPIELVPLDEDRERFYALDPLMAEANTKVAARKASARESYQAYIKDPARKLDASWTKTSSAPTTHIPLVSADPRWLDFVNESQYQRLALSADATLVDGHISGKAWQVNNLFPTIASAGDIERDQPFSVSLWVRPSSGNQGGALIARMDESNDFRGWDVWMENGSIGMHLINKWPENALKAVSQKRLTENQWHHVAITYDGTSKIEGIKIFINGEQSGTNIQSRMLSESIRTTVPFTIGKRSATSPTTGAQLQDVRIYSSVLDNATIQTVGEGMRRSYLIAKDTRSEAEENDLYEWYLRSVDTEYGQLLAAANQLTSEKETLRRRGTVAHVMHEANKEPMAHILVRGDYDKRGEVVKPATPAALPPMGDELPRNRLGFAQWLLKPENPLTARVTVNRFWQEVFGRGLVGSSGDFGITGELPTHPELLDYMAVSFRENGWNVKEFFRTIVTSSTYRQSSATSPERAATDPANALLGRGPRFRMDAEMIRDTSLSTSGLLVGKIGGPSVKPYQPTGVWEAVAMPESNTRNYVADKGENLYRRSLYTFLKRAAPPPNMEVFNATAREVCTIKRERTNTPLQALVTLNDTQFVEAARILAEKTLLDPALQSDNLSRIQSISEKLLARPFRVEEMQVVQSSLIELLSYYQNNPEDSARLLAVGETRSSDKVNPSELAAWTMLINQLMNLDEVLTK
jgi:mono/diheme cytochrome c family protein